MLWIISSVWRNVKKIGSCMWSENSRAGVCIRKISKKVQLRSRFRCSEKILFDCIDKKDLLNLFKKIERLKLYKAFRSFLREFLLFFLFFNLCSDIFKHKYMPTYIKLAGPSTMPTPFTNLLILFLLSSLMCLVSSRYGIYSIKQDSY